MATTIFLPIFGVGFHASMSTYGSTFMLTAVTLVDSHRSGRTSFGRGQKPSYRLVDGLPRRLLIVRKTRRGVHLEAVPSPVWRTPEVDTRDLESKVGHEGLAARGAVWRDLAGLNLDVLSLPGGVPVVCGRRGYSAGENVVADDMHSMIVARDVALELCRTPGDLSEPRHMFHVQR